MTGLYIHFPFCRSRCCYCGFFSTTLLKRRQAYVQALEKEMAQRAGYLQGETIQTVYLGGGTPSQLTEEQLSFLTLAMERILPGFDPLEMTLEANPDDVTPQFVRSLKSLPFNRISLGIQTFQDDILKLINRRHTAKEASDAVRRIQDAGIGNVSVDLIYGLPFQSLELWQEDLRKALELSPRHLSAYCLSYEEGTLMEKMLRDGKIPPVDEQTLLSAYRMLVKTLKEAGYTHYEISNFALEGWRSRHNSSYWDGTPYLGLGAGAHSYDGKSRRWNVSHLSSYIQGIEKGKPGFGQETLDDDTRYNEMVMTRLRTREGILLDSVRELWGQKRRDYLLKMAAKGMERGLLEITEGRLKLTEEGVFLSDGLISEMMWV